MNASSEARSDCIARCYPGNAFDEVETKFEVPLWWKARLGLERSRTWLGDAGYDLIIDDRRLRHAETEMLCLELLRRIDSGRDMWPVGNQDHWERVWNDVRARFEETGDLEALRPPFVRPFQPVRVNGAFCWMIDPDFEWHWWTRLRQFIFEEWLADCPRIVEYGCGSGHNLAAFAQLAPGKEYVGVDFSEAAAKCVRAVGKRQGWNMAGVPADVRNPPWLRMTPETGVLTVGALEQTGLEWRPFMDDLVEQKPRVVVHVEPIIEWLDETGIVDYTARRFMVARGYWSGFPAWLKRQEDEGRVEVLHRHRTGVGSLWIEGYMLNVWRPR